MGSLVHDTSQITDIQSDISRYNGAEVRSPTCMIFSLDCANVQQQASSELGHVQRVLPNPKH